MANIDDLRKELDLTERRLTQRRLQKAQMGISADPSIDIEIEDLTNQVEALQAEIARLGGDAPGAATGNPAAGPAQPGGGLFNQTGQQIGGAQYNVAGDLTINTGDTYSGDFRGAILTMRSTLSQVSQAIGTMPAASAADKETLAGLIADLQTALEAVVKQSPASAEDAEAVAETTKALVEQANQPKPNPSLLKITGEGLVKAAENLQTIVPAVLDISRQIVSFVLGIGS